MKAREVKKETINGREVYRVPLDREKTKWATVWAEDYELLVGIGLSPNWSSAHRQGYILAPAYKHPNNQVMVARVLLNAGPGETVGYKDRDKRNLTRDNLYIKINKLGRLRDRDYIQNKQVQKVA